jgi:hypothetical protein
VPACSRAEASGKSSVFREREPCPRRDPPRASRLHTLGVRSAAAPIPTPRGLRSIDSSRRRGARR